METGRVAEEMAKPQEQMIQDASLAKAVAGIPQRSEKQSDIQKLVGDLVDVGICPQIDSVNSQII